MKAAYYIRILPYRILALPPEEFFRLVVEEDRVHWQEIEAWNWGHAKQIGTEIRRCIEVLDR